MTLLIGNSLFEPINFHVSNKNNSTISQENRYSYDIGATTVFFSAYCNIELQDYSDLLTRTQIGTRLHTTKSTTTPLNLHGVNEK